MCFRSALWVRYSSWSKHCEPLARLQGAHPTVQTLLILCSRRLSGFLSLLFRLHGNLQI